MLLAVLMIVCVLLGFAGLVFMAIIHISVAREEARRHGEGYPKADPW